MLSRQSIPESVLRCLPRHWRDACQSIPLNMQEELIELRLRVGAPFGLVFRGRKQRWLGPQGPVADASRVPTFSRNDGEQLLQAISDSSVYALEEQLRQGFMTLPGGHRVGFCGEAVMGSHGPRTVKHVGSFMIRVARSVAGCGKRVLPHIVDGRGYLRSTLIVSPPGCGKTTLLRDLIRCLSSGSFRDDRTGLHVGVVDERSEIAATYKGVPSHDLGPRVDVMDNAPKSFGIMQLLRSMAPDVIATDEIGRPADAEAIREALHGGVAVLATAHGSSLEDVARRPGLQLLFEPMAFERVIVLSDRRGPGTIESVLNARSSGPSGHKSSIPSIHIR